MRRVAYSLVGLLVGNLCLLPFSLGPMAEVYFLISLFGWMFIGYPFVLFLPVRIVLSMRWWLIPFGLLLGPLALDFVFRFRVDFMNLHGDDAMYMVFASFLSGIAMATYYGLLRRYIDDQEKAL